VANFHPVLIPPRIQEILSGLRADDFSLISETEFFNTIGHEQPFEQTSICSECACFVKIIASIEDPAVINQILAHLDEKAATARLPPCRAPPATGLLV